MKPVGQVAVNQSQYGLPGMQPGVFGEMVVPGGGVMPSENRTDEDDDDEQTVDELIGMIIISYQLLMIDINFYSSVAT